jgi:hypothetical protein
VSRAQPNDLPRLGPPTVVYSFGSIWGAEFNSPCELGFLSPGALLQIYYVLRNGLGPVELVPPRNMGSPVW